MNQKTTQRGFTQNAVHKNCHSRGIFPRHLSFRNVLMRDIGAAHTLYPAFIAARRVGVTERVARGFTLIELLVVVLIIGILSAVALPQYNKAVRKAQGTEALIVLDALDKAIHSYYLEHDTFESVTPEILNIDLPELKHWRYVGTENPGSYQTGTLQISTIRLAHGADELGFNIQASVSLYSKEGLYIVARWSNREPWISATCYGGGQVSCGEYFNCNATPRTFIKGPNIWTGGDCTIK